MSDHFHAAVPPPRVALAASVPARRPTPPTPLARAPSPSVPARHYPHADAFQDVHDVHLYDDAQGARRG